MLLTNASTLTCRFFLGFISQVSCIPLKVDAQAECPCIHLVKLGSDVQIIPGCTVNYCCYRCASFPVEFTFTCYLCSGCKCLLRTE